MLVAIHQQLAVLGLEFCPALEGAQLAVWIASGRELVGVHEVRLRVVAILEGRSLARGIAGHGRACRSEREVTSFKKNECRKMRRFRFLDPA